MSKSAKILSALSLITVLANLGFYFYVKNSDIDTVLAATIFFVVSGLGVLFSLLTKRIEMMLIGVTLNLGMIVIILFLLLSIGLSMH